MELVATLGNINIKYEFNILQIKKFQCKNCMLQSSNVIWPYIYLSFYNRIVADILNMLQPVYVFVIFVCKHNVLNIILGHDARRTTAISSAAAKRRKQSQASQVILNPAFTTQSMIPSGNSSTTLPD